MTASEMDTMAKIRAGTRAGLEVAEFSISGMTGEECVRKIENGLQAIPGVERALVDLDSAHLLVEYVTGSVEVDRLRETIRCFGYHSLSKNKD